MKTSISILFICLALASVSSAEKTLRFYATPYKVYEGDAVLFHYVEDTEEAKKIPIKSIASWQWDFDDDGTIDLEGTVPEDIEATWYAVYDGSRADSNGLFRVKPQLYVTLTNGASYSQDGITEDTHGTGKVVDEYLLIEEQSEGNDEIRVDFSGGPRLAIVGDQINFYSDVTLLKDGEIVSYEWDLDDGVPGTESTESNPSWTYTETNEYTVTLTVNYTLNGVTGVKTLAETKTAYISIVADKGALSEGRSYRKGFPHEYGWEDIIKAYSARAVGNDRYLYYHKFEEAYRAKQDDIVNNSPDSVQSKDLAEIANECLQGQVMLGNQRLVEALRIKYPRMVNFDPENPPEVLPAPPGVREETLAIDVALLDFYAALLYPADVIERYGPDVLRSRALEKPPYPQFPRYISFVDPSLSPFEIPIKNEYWQLTTCLERMGLGSVEKAKKLFRLSLHDETARDESKEECKKAGTQCYLGMALLAAGQSEDDFALNQGNLLLAHLKNSRDLFEMINQGLTPLIDNGDFIPNESFAAIYQDAQDAVNEAREAEINARQEERTYDRYQAELRQEQLNQRNSYITPLYNLTHLDPVLYNNLQTVDDQKDFRNTVRSRVKALDEDYPNANPAILGELGELVLNVKDQGLAVEQAVNNIDNLYKRVELAKWANVQATEVLSGTSDKIQTLDLLGGIAQGLMNTRGGTASDYGLAALGGAILGQVSASKTRLATLQTMQLNTVSSEKEIRGQLLELNNLGVALERTQSQFKQAEVRLSNALSQMDRLIEDLAHTRNTAADLYFQDPSFRVVVSRAMRRAEAEMDYAIDRLYRLAKTLEYEWTEAYQNPVIIPVDSNEPASLENPLFDKFTQLESLFAVQTADETKDYLDALKAWDSKLRRINVTSVRGPNHAGPITAEPISLREDILGFRTDDGTMTTEESYRAFRDYLETKRVENIYNVWNPSLEFDFQTTIEDNRFFPATGSRWNMRVNSISIDLYAESGFSTKQVAEVDLIESGVVSLRHYWDDPPFADDPMRLTFNIGVREDRSAFGIVVPSKINGASGGRPAEEFVAMGLQNRPIAATQWLLRIDTENPSNADIDFSKLKDIVIRYTYTYGNPPEFPGF